MRWLSRLFGGKKKSAGSAQKTPEAAPEPTGPYLTQTVVFGMHPYRRKGDDSSVFFVDKTRGIRKMLVDTYGNIQNFPGILQEEFWVKRVTPNSMEPQICFRTSFEPHEKGWLVLWEIQPDGRYWEDEDGFGAEPDPEVLLYTFVDRNGEFTGPFRIYKLGTRRFYPPDQNT